MSECVESVHAAEGKQVKECAKISEKVISEGGDAKSKDEDKNEVDGSQAVKRKSLADGDKEDEVIKKPKKDEGEDDAGDEEAASVKTDEEDGSEKEAEGAEDAEEDEEAPNDKPAS